MIGLRTFTDGVVTSTSGAPIGVGDGSDGRRVEEVDVLHGRVAADRRRRLLGGRLVGIGAHDRRTERGEPVAEAAPIPLPAPTTSARRPSSRKRSW